MQLVQIKWVRKKKGKNLKSTETFNSWETRWDIMKRNIEKESLRKREIDRKRMWESERVREWASERVREREREAQTREKNRPLKRKKQSLGIHVAKNRKRTNRWRKTRD